MHSTHVHIIITAVIIDYRAICSKLYNFVCISDLRWAFGHVVIINKLKFHNRMIFLPFTLLDLCSARSIMGMVNVSKMFFCVYYCYLFRRGGGGGGGGPLHKCIE